MEIYELNESAKTNKFLKLTQEDLEKFENINKIGKKMGAHGIMVAIDCAEVEVVTEISKEENVEHEQKPVRIVENYKTKESFSVLKFGKNKVTLLGDKGKKELKRTTFDKGYRKVNF